MEEQKKKRLRIGICDDELLSLNRIRKMAERVLGDQWDLDVVCTYSPEELLAHAAQVQIVLLDIQLPEQNGIMLARALLEKNPGCCIIFVSGYVQFVSDVYDVPHFCMVLKDQMDTQLPKYLLRAACISTGQESQLVVRINGMEQTVAMETVSHLERRGHVTYINLQNGQQFQTREKLDDLLDRAHCSYICRCHVSFAANVQWVASMREKEFIMKNGGIVPISRTYRQSVKKQYFDYLKSKL